MQVAIGVALGLTVTLVATFRWVIPDLAGDDAARLLADPFPAPSLTLTTPDGDAWSLEELRGSVAAVFFGYTNCPDVCPLTLARLARHREERTAVQPALEVVFVSVDPRRDTPERLRAFVEGLPGSVLGVTAPEEEVRAQARDFGVMVRDREVEGLPDGDYLVDHTARTFIVDPEGLVVATLQPMATPEEIQVVLDAVFRSLRRR